MLKFFSMLKYIISSAIKIKITFEVIFSFATRTDYTLANNKYYPSQHLNLPKTLWIHFHTKKKWYIKVWYPPCSIISTRFLRCGRMAQPIRIAICCTILMPVCLACHDFLLLHTAFKNGSRDGIPRADATTANALAVVLRTYSSMLSMSGLIVEIMVARPAACQIHL